MPTAESPKHTCYREGGYSLWSALHCDACATALMARPSEAGCWTPMDLASALTTFHKTGAIPSDKAEWLMPSIFDLERTQRLAAHLEALDAHR